MTGRIRSVSTSAGGGSIRGEDGQELPFELSAVLEYDLSCLTAGQVVTFDVELLNGPMAVNVAIQKVHASPLEPRSREAANLRYVGFDHKQGLRAYKFELLSPGTQKRTFAVTADLAMFARHHIAIQEGPVLCLRLLTAELQAVGPEDGKAEWALADRDMLAHLASRSAPAAKARIKRAPRDAAFSHLV